MSPPNWPGDSFFTRGDIADFFAMMEEREMDMMPLVKLDNLLGQFGPALIFKLVMDTLHEMGDLENILDIVEPMAAAHRTARRNMEIYERRSRRDTFYSADFGREESAIVRGRHDISGSFIIDDIDASTIEMMRDRLNPLDYRDSDIFREQVRRKRTKPNRR